MNVTSWPRSVESARHEFTEVCNACRHYSQLRFAVLTVGVAVVGALASVAMNAGSLPMIDRWLVILAGTLATVTFWRYEQLIEDRMKELTKRAESLESELDGYAMFTGRNRFPRSGAHQASGLLFGSMMMFWALKVVYLLTEARAAVQSLILGA